MYKLFTKGLSFILILSVFFTFSASPALAAVTYTYDANGNMLSDGDQCYHYNEANQMDKVTKCSNGQTIAEYVYDYTGMRLVKKEFENGVLKKTIYSPADEYETVKQASNGATANTNYYKANDELIAKKNPDGSITYYHNDHLGSSAVLSDETGAVVEKTSYEPYGEVKSGGTKSKFGYTGQEQDNETGLNYYNARYYDPHIQRFIQPDTLLPNIFDPQQLNRYSYANNNPLKYTDPTGHSIWGLIWNVVKAAVAPVVKTIAESKIVKPVIDTIAKNPTVAKIIGFMTPVTNDPVVKTALSNVDNQAKMSSNGINTVTTVAKATTGTIYWAVNQATQIPTYVGKTIDFSRRAGEHWRISERIIKPIPGLEEIPIEHLRAVEQVMIERARILNPNLDNIRNAISPNNPIYNSMIDIGRQYVMRAGYL